jgi:tetraacyldisaccharide 4'-kinase
VPVVAVGNLTLGGTGKTPMVESVARRYRARGLRVAILSRGYGQSDGLNDEGRVLEENLPDVPHLQDRDRARLARVAVEELESELLVLDDGFQHRRLARDLDIVLLDALDPFGLGRVFPRGLLREPVRALRRAGIVVLSRADLVSGPDRAAIRREAERRAGPLRWVEARHAPLDLIDARGLARPLDDLVHGKVAAFCGIGNPEGFRRTLVPLCGTLGGFRTFPDHHPYRAADVADLTAWSRSLDVDLALTTQKDLVKLRAETLGPIPLSALRIGLEILTGADILDGALDSLAPPRP